MKKKVKKKKKMNDTGKTGVRTLPRKKGKFKRKKRKEKKCPPLTEVCCKSGSEPFGLRIIGPTVITWNT